MLRSLLLGEVAAPTQEINPVLRWQAGDSEQELLLPPFVAYDFEASDEISDYPLVMTNIAVENHHFEWENPL